MVNGARHTKGKVKRNGRPKDLDVTEKEYREKCGQVQKFNLSMPLRLNEFNELPKDLQREYFHRLVEILNMNPMIIGNMLGCCRSTVLLLMKRAGFSYPSNMSKRFSRYHDDWRNFFARDERFAHLMDSFDKAEKPVEESNEKQETFETPTETAQVSAQENLKKSPEIMAMTVRIYADSIDELISQLETMKGQPIMGKTLTIEVVKG